MIGGDDRRADLGEAVDGLPRRQRAGAVVPVAEHDVP